MSDWIMWGGGVCPVPAGTGVEVKYRNGDTVSLLNMPGLEATSAFWRHDGRAYDIVAYRVIGDFIAVDGVEYPYGCGAKVPEGRQIEQCGKSDENGCYSHWRLKPLAPAVDASSVLRAQLNVLGYDVKQPLAPIEVALQAAADDEPDDPSLLESQITGFMEGIGASDDHKAMIAAFKSLGISDATVNHMMCKLVGTFDGPKRTSLGLLSQAANIQAERAREYEQAGGERSTAKIVAAFNAITGREDMMFVSIITKLTTAAAGLEVNESWPDRAALIETLQGCAKLLEGAKSPALRESEGWLFLQLLKMVRGEAKRTPHMDSIVDNVSYAALYGEARAAGR